MAKERRQGQFDGVTMTKVVIWLQQHKDELHKVTFDNAAIAFDKAHGTQVARSNFKTAARELGVVFANGKARRGSSVKNQAYAPAMIGYVLRQLVEDVEQAVGGPVASKGVTQAINAMIGRKGYRATLEALNNPTQTPQEDQ